MYTEKIPATVVAVAGSAGLDVTLRDPPRHWIGEVPRDVYTHRTLQPLHSPPEMGLGGNGGSASYVLGKLGRRVHLNAPIGQDPAGQLVRGWLERAGVKCTAPTGRSTMQAITAVDASGRRLGTLQHVGPALDWSLSAQDGEATWLLASLPGQIPLEVLPQVLNLLEDFGGGGRVRRWCDPLANVAGACAAGVFLWFAVVAMTQSIERETMIRTAFVIPEWWVLAVAPASMALILVEFARRLLRAGGANVMTGL